MKLERHKISWRSHQAKKGASVPCFTPARVYLLPKTIA